MSCISLVLENIEKKDISLIFTLCLSAPDKSALENSLVKFWPVKPLPAEKSLNFQPPRCILLNLIHPRANWYSPAIFWTSPRWVLILPWWYHSDSARCLLGPFCLFLPIFYGKLGTVIETVWTRIFLCNNLLTYVNIFWDRWT